MTCIIDSVILYLAKRGETAKVIREHIKEKYRISIDIESIRQRLKNLGGHPGLT